MQVSKSSRGETRLRSLLDSAATLFLERGYDALSMDAVIARAGGSRRNIYDRFGGKEGLFVEVVRRLCDTMAEPIEALPLNEERLEDSLRTFGLALLQIVLDPQTLALHRLMVAEGARFPALAQAVYRAGHHRATLILAAFLQRWRERSEAWGSEIPSQILATHFVGLVTAEAQLRGLIGLDPLPLPDDEAERIVDQALCLFLNRL